MKICIKILVFVWLAVSWTAAAGQHVDVRGRASLRIDSIVHDTDLWTCGQLILFSSKEPVVCNEHGRVVSGMLGNNSLILCADSRFREFARDFHVTFDDKGLLVSGTMSTPLEIVIQEQHVTSIPHTEVAFFPNGVIKYFVPSDNFRYTTADGFKFSVAAGNKVTFDEEGRLRTAIMARRRIMQNPDGTQRVFLPGDVVKIDETGLIE